jgi:hypothetical protein
MMNPDLGKARSAELHRQARSARLGEYAHRARGGGGLLELRVGLAYVLVKWGLALLRPERAEELDGRDAERLLEDAA